MFFLFTPLTTKEFNNLMRANRNTHATFLVGNIKSHTCSLILSPIKSVQIIFSDIFHVSMFLYTIKMKKNIY